MMRTTCGAVGAVMAIAVVAGACSDGEDAGGDRDQRQAYVDAFVASGSDEALSDEDNVCFAEAIVDAVGVAKLKDQVTTKEVRQAEDALPSDLGVEVSQKEGEAFYDAVNDCIDVEEYFGHQIDSDDTLTDDNKTCLKQELDAQFLHTFYVTLYAQGAEGFSTDSDLMNEINAAYETCGVSQT